MTLNARLVLSSSTRFRWRGSPPAGDNDDNSSAQSPHHNQLTKVNKNEKQFEFQQRQKNGAGRSRVARVQGSDSSSWSCKASNVALVFLLSVVAVQFWFIQQLSMSNKSRNSNTTMPENPRIPTMIRDQSPPLHSEENQGFYDDQRHRLRDHNTPAQMVKNSTTRRAERTNRHMSDSKSISFPVIALGLPKGGSTLLFDLFHCNNIPSQHYFCCGTQKSLKSYAGQGLMSSCLIHNLANERPMLEYCGSYQAFAEINGPREKNRDGQVLMDDGTFQASGPRIFLPQTFHIDKIHAQYPNATFILQHSPIDSWIQTVLNLGDVSWNPALATELINEFSAQGVLSSHDTAGLNWFNRTEMEGLLRIIYHYHHEKVRDFVKAHPTHDYIEVNIEDDFQKINNSLLQPLGLSPRCWKGADLEYIPGKKLVIIIPFRDSADGRSQGKGRRDNLRQWLAYMRSYLPEDIVSNSHVYIVEQTEKGVFNKGLMFNAGFNVVEFDGSCDYMVLHDVDQIPDSKQDNRIYYYRSRPAKLIDTTTRRATENSTEEVRKLLKNNVGGALMVTPAVYRLVNGYSNNFGGWGGEDDNFANRLKRKKVKYEVLSGRFRELYHERVWGLDSTPQFTSNLLNKKDFTSGISDAKFSIVRRNDTSFEGSWNITHVLVEVEQDLELKGDRVSGNKDMNVSFHPSHMKRFRNMCDGLFDFEAIQPTEGRERCISHINLGWVSCYVGAVSVDREKIMGSTGGEAIESVSGRDEKDESLLFLKGAIKSEKPLPAMVTRQMNEAMRKALSSVVVSPEVVGQDPEPVSRLEGPTFIVKRGDYANPCMSIASIYNVFVAMKKFNVTSPNIVWLDGHAAGSLDGVWADLFQAKVVHVKQLPSGVFIEEAFVVNQLSAFGDEGIKIHRWGEACHNSSSLHQFRDFVLEKYQVKRSVTETKLVTFLIGQNYKAHPRSDGITDRAIANVEADRAYVESLYPGYHIDVVSFEEMPFQDQLAQIVKTDILVAVHGAGNIHSIFLPDNAKFVEFFPPKFKSRKRFRFLAESIGVHYTAMLARVVSSRNGKVQVTIQP